MRNLIITLLLLLLLAGCRQENEAATAVSPSLSPSPSPIIAIVPLPTLTPEATAVPSPTTTPIPTATSAPPAPSPTPTPAFPVYQGPPLNRKEIGVQVHIHHEDIAAIMANLQTLGVGWVKVQVSWKLYQPAPDRYDDVLLAELDNLVAAAQANDVSVLLNVAKAPEWSRSTTELDGPPQDYALYRAFMQFLAQRYQGRVAAYELWNEANLQREWNGAPLSAADAAALMRAGAEGVRSSDAAALLISGAPATTGINDGVIAIDDRVFMRQLLAAGIGDVVDGIGVHPYGWANPPDSSVTDGETAVPSHNNHPSFFFQDTITDYLALLDEFGVADSLWVTEFGWGSFEGFFDEAGTPAAPPGGAEFMAYVSQWQQAEYILRAFEMGQAWEQVGPMILWNLNFGPLLGSEFSESGYSLLNRANEPRPAYLALAHAAKE
ncbi:MAG: cellulase family glycosylhydrolase [Ardenticatenaceae bacterium]|nr:cellulase family glycosylhydrolase [Ardenticatenaceae bacterium]MCB8986383.1 cellulase family glycosylhydrolase [Ardenticatenaceae bacterium]